MAGFFEKLKSAEVFHFDKINTTWMISLSLSRKTVQESLFKISLEHHNLVPEHFFKIDSEMKLLAEKNYAAGASCVTFRLVYVRVVQGKFS